MRLDKLLSHEGYGSRKEVKALISSGSVTIDGRVVKQSNVHVDPTQQEVSVAGEEVRYEPFVYWMLNKPQGVISATEDSHHSTVLDCLDPEDLRPDLFPVGRLDIDTTGLLLITNHGPLNHALTSPKKAIAKVYQATIQGIVNQEMVEVFAEGIDLGDFTTQPAKLEILKVDPNQEQSAIQVTITEGKFHQVKRMFAACGVEVIRLHRLSMGPLLLDSNLEAGGYRRLTASEEDQLRPYGLE